MNAAHESHLAGTPPQLNGIVRAALAHLWFETIHPFEDGNGRLGRAIVDLALAQDTGSFRHLFSLSSELLRSRRDYYDALNAAQRGTLDVTTWVLWFVQVYTADKYARMTGTSKATATRDLGDLLANSLLVVEGVGKATRYAVNVEGWNQTV